MMQRLIIILVMPMSIPAWIKRRLNHTAQAIRINPDYAKAHYNLGIAYVNSGMDIQRRLSRTGRRSGLTLIF